MKKIYFLLLTFSLCFMSFSQSPIVTYGRSNAVNPTNTGTVANISAIGFTRGAGISSSNGTSHTSKSWNGNSQVEAAANSEFIQWSVTADAGYDIDLSGFDIRLNRNNNGPQNFQIFYSLDGFASTVLPLTVVRTVNQAETDYNASAVINSGDGGTVTFRLYAWNAANPGGTLTIAEQTAWADFGITQPGARLSGTVNAIPVNSAESTIETTLFDPSQNINYLTYTTPSGLTTTNSLKVGEFIILDGGTGATDADLLPTILTDLTIDISSFDNLAALAIINNGINVAEVTNVTASTTFNNINAGAGIIAPDDGSNVFSLYATFNTTVSDNDQMDFQISSATADVIVGSGFAEPDAGGAVTRSDLDYNRIEVTATELNFGIQPTDTRVFETISPSPTVYASDINGNIDFDYIGEIIISSNNAVFSDSSTLNLFATNGIAVFDNIVFITTANDEELVATSVDLSFSLSNFFDILDYIIIIAQQDFDLSTPDWPYTSDTPFFDNSWGTDGYYDIIDISNASPLDYAPFINNILGANDLNDEGGGTAGFATVSFEEINIAAYDNVSISFDYDISGFATNDDVEYELFFDGVSQGTVILDTSGNIEGTVTVAIPDATDTLALEVRVSSNGEGTFAGFDNFLVQSAFEGLIHFVDTWTPFAPNNTTGDQNALVISGTYSVGSTDIVNNLLVLDAGDVFIESGEFLQVNGEFITNDNVFMNSTSLLYSNLIVQGNVSGNITYSRHVNTNAAVGGNDLISAPATGQTFAEMASDNPNLFSNPANPTEKLFGPFDKTTGLYLTYDTAIPAEASVILEPGIGYRAASSDGGNLEFTGTVTTGPVNVPIVIAGPNSPEWNLVGNPYTSYITLSDFLAANNSQFDPVSSGIYGYDGDASDGWSIWNQAYSDANPDAAITPGQGFLVSSATPIGTISFTPDMRVNENSDDFIPGRLSNPTAIEHVKLQLSNNIQNYNTDFYFTDNATLGQDSGYDSSIFNGVAPNFSIYSHLLQNNLGLDYAIQSLRYSDFSDVTIPLGVKANQNQEITISIVESSLPESVDVYLDDIVSNTVTLLNNNGGYTITPSEDLNGTGRFFLRFSDASLSTDEFIGISNIKIFATINPKSLFVKGTLDSPTVIKIYDMQGRIVLNTNLNTFSNYNQVDLSNLLSGVYSVSLSNKSLSKTQKIIIK